MAARGFKTRRADDAVMAVSLITTKCVMKLPWSGCRARLASKANLLRPGGAGRVESEDYSRHKPIDFIFDRG